MQRLRCGCCHRASPLQVLRFDNVEGFFNLHDVKFQMVINQWWQIHAGSGKKGSMMRLAAAVVDFVVVVVVVVVAAW